MALTEERRAELSEMHAPVSGGTPDGSPADAAVLLDALATAESALRAVPGYPEDLTRLELES